MIKTRRIVALASLALAVVAGGIRDTGYFGSGHKPPAEAPVV